MRAMRASVDGHSCQAVSATDLDPELASPIYRSSYEQRPQVGRFVQSSTQVQSVTLKIISYPSSRSTPGFSALLGELQLHVVYVRRHHIQPEGRGAEQQALCAHS